MQRGVSGIGPAQQKRRKVVSLTVLVTVLFVGWVFVYAQVIAAALDDMLTVRDMQHAFGRNAQGLPFMAHGGMWGDVFLISPLVAVIAGYYGNTWSHHEIVGWLTAGFIASYGMHQTYKSVPWREAHVAERKLTIAGHIHFVYMGVAFAAIGWYIFRPMRSGELSVVVAVTALITIHIVLGTHVVLGILKSWRPERVAWYPGDPLHSFGTWGPILGVMSLGCGRAAWLACVGY